MCVSDKAEIQSGLLAYLVGNPRARDTLEGIVEWWLLEQKIKHNTAEVSDVLDDLVAKKLVLKYKSRDTRVRYGINPRKEKDIRALLKRAR
jgi:hypothetical protein